MDEVTKNLQEALTIIQGAVNKSISLLEKGESQQAIGQVWSQFVGSFFQLIKEKSKQSQRNLLAFVKLPKF